MKIYVKATHGGTLELDVNGTDTIYNVKERVQEAEGIPTDEQWMTYAGKQLENDRCLSDYVIQQWATISLLLRNKSNRPSPATDSKAGDFPRKGEALRNPQSQAQANLPTSLGGNTNNLTNGESDFRQGFDEDDHLMDPVNHYRTLDNLEKMVVERSAFYHSKGNLGLIVSCLKIRNTWPNSLHCSPEVSKRLNKIRCFSTMGSFPPGKTNRSTIDIALNLGESYLILSNVLDMIKLSSQQQFCNDAFTMLIHRTAKRSAIAEMVQIERSTIVDFHGHIDTVITKILRPGRPLSDHITSTTLLEDLWPACHDFMETLGIPFPGRPSPNEMLLLCRTLTLLLDVGLVSYMGSHGSRFDLEYLGEDHSTLFVEADDHSRVGFLFSLHRLACLDQFLNRRRVWALQPLWMALGYSDDARPPPPLSILTSIEAFADTWGPIWEVPASKEFPSYIRQMNVATGLICRAETTTQCPVEDAVSCHWFDSSGIMPLPTSKEHANTLIRRCQKLLISGLPETSLKTNKLCSYKLDDLEKDYGLYMTPLGTSSSTWTYDERQVGFSASQYIGISVLGTQKKLPCVTQKQAIWNKWTNQPTRANPRILNSYLGVEISHCTGNARRIKLRDLFTMQPIQALIERQYPDWIMSDFGMSLQSAFFSEDDFTIEDVWVKSYKSREQMAQLICCVLELLERTGTKAGIFSAAFLNQTRELSMPVEPRLNSWSDFLEDTHLTAVYAIITENCLDSGEMGNFVTTCNSSSKPTGFTVLETQIAIPQTDTSRDKIWLNQRGCLQWVSNTDKGVQVLTWNQAKARELGGRLGKFLGSRHTPNLSREVQDIYELGGEHVPVLVKSIVPSHGGLPMRRTLKCNIPMRQPTGENRVPERSTPLHIPISTTLHVPLPTTRRDGSMPIRVVRQEQQPYFRPPAR